MSQSKLLLLALIGGLLIGVLVRLSHLPMALAIATGVQPLGALWLSALKMTLVPLIFAMVADGVGTFTASREGGRTARLMLGLFAGLLLFAASYAMGFASLLVHLFPPPQGALTSLIGPVSASPPPPTVGVVQQLLNLIPDNPVAAAAGGQMAPLVVFAVLFGIAASGIPEPRRTGLAQTLKAVGETMMRIVQGVLWFAPLGVFVLALGVAASAGLAGAAVLGEAVAIQIVVGLGGIALSYLIATLGGVGFKRFAGAAMGPTAMAAGCCSSMATLPALIKAAETKLGVSATLAGSALPLAVATFRFGSAVSVTTAAAFTAAACGVHLGLGQCIAVVGLVVLSNIGIAGLPGAAVVYAAYAPVFQMIGLPLAIIPLYIAVIAIPDMVITVSNVTADLSVTGIVHRVLAGRGSAVEGVTEQATA
jgi:proton glutamate symport protein